MAKLFVNGAQVVSPIGCEYGFISPNPVISLSKKFCSECDTHNDCPINKGMGCAKVLKEYGIFINDYEIEREDNENER